MRRYLLMTALFLTTSCAREGAEYLVPDVPEELRRPVIVTCADGNTRGDLGTCAMKIKAGLRKANAQIAATDEILRRAEAGNY